MATVLRDRLAKLIAFIFDQDRKANPMPPESKKAIKHHMEMKMKKTDAKGACHQTKKEN